MLPPAKWRYGDRPNPSPVDPATGRRRRQVHFRRIYLHVTACLKRRQQVGGHRAPPRGLGLGNPGLVEGRQSEVPKGRIGVRRCAPSRFETCRGSGDGARAIGKAAREAEPTRPAVTASVPLRLLMRRVDDQGADGGGSTAPSQAAGRARAG